MWLSPIRTEGCYPMCKREVAIVITISMPSNMCWKVSRVCDSAADKAVGGALLDAYHLAQINVSDNISTVLQSELNRYTT